ncbi:glycosyltransferase, group 1 family protein [Thermosipho africanus Ob7]|uniref:Glycosyltransferase, group 1 family n=1 Tax=Thermosipho africanus (strain TCF52B) TaxID=484019 RepID=B7IGY2_THEAB|nr:glycosyltransferase [Thermosipho africanus]ACJ75346.1 glycosyltransferase, group 1 family [Thermosipho africanus TCF52B]RDI90810.1 glycosyltransferase, group 1 family protein [Thermosipho africanus Ob7]
MRKKILHIVTRSDWTGVQKVLYNIVSGLKSNYSDQFEVEVAAGKENGMLFKELEKIGIRYYVLENLVREINPIKDLKAYFELKKLIKNGNYDIVHIHSSKAGVLGRIAAKRCGVKKVIYTYHGFWGIEQYKGFKKKFLILAERIAAKYSDYLVFLCNREKQKAEKYKIGKPHQYVIIPNAILPIENVQKGKLRKELSLPDNVKIIGNVARLDPPKNPIRFLEIAKKIINVRSDVVFVWIGESIVNDFYGKIVQNYLSKYPILRERVYFLPFRNDAPDLMTDFDLFLLTSDSEGAPLVILEARGNGIPIVSTDVGCVSEMIEEDFVSNDDYCLSKIVLDLLDKNINLESNKENYYKEFLVKYVSIYNEFMLDRDLS